MIIPQNCIVNADDFGIRPSVNKVIAACFKTGIINSTSLLVNTDYFDESVNLIKSNPSIKNIGVHVNLAENKPVTNFNRPLYLHENGEWNLAETNKITRVFDKETKELFKKEIFAQVEKALSAGIKITHLDSHYHIHTLPCFYQLFIQAALYFKLKLRLAQTTNEGNFVKFLYRKNINRKIENYNIQYSDLFETVSHFLTNGTGRKSVIEIMLHPDMDEHGNITDHYDASEMKNWLSYLENKKL
jgi:chitin disaccharide deacetylase